MFVNPLLKKRNLLPKEASIVAEIIDDNGGKISRQELEESVRNHEKVGLDEIDNAVRLLRMTDNLKIEDEKAVLTPLEFYENEGPVTDTVVHSFKEWREEAQKENMGTIAEIRRE